MKKQGIRIFIFALAIQLCLNGIIDTQINFHDQTQFYGISFPGATYHWVTQLEHGQIKTISGNEDTFIHSLKFQAAHGIYADHSQSVGGTGGIPFSWTVPDGQYISYIQCTTEAGGGLKSIKFTTNKLVQLYIGSPGDGGSFSENIPEHMRIVGIFLNHDQYVRGITFYLRKIQKSQLFGSDGGIPFSWFTFLENAEIRSVHGWKGNNLIHRLRVNTANEITAALSGNYGVNNGNPFTWYVPNGQYLKSIFLKIGGGGIQDINFVTNEGISSSDEQFFQTQNIFSLNQHTRIAGIFGSHNGLFITGLGFYLRKIPKTPVFGISNGYVFNWLTSLEDAHIKNVHYDPNTNVFRRIRVETSNGITLDASDFYGPNSGGFAIWTFPDNQYINQIQYTTIGGVLQSIKFVTNLGQSSQFGSPNPNELTIYSLPQHTRLVGIYGTLNTLNQFITALGFYCRDIPKTPEFGSSIGGTSFSWLPSSGKTEIREIFGQYQIHINKIRASTYNGIVNELSEFYGFSGQYSYHWQVPSNDYIARIIYKKKIHLQSLIFVTNQQQCSPRFGGKNSNPGTDIYEYILPKYARIVGIYGHLTSSFIGGLGFYYRRHQ